MFSSYRKADCDQVAELWTQINRELTPAHMRDLFEQCIATALAGEPRQAQEIFSPARRNDRRNVTPLFAVAQPRADQPVSTFRALRRGDQ
jgi:hypothetical protein